VAKVETHDSRTAETADACLYSSRVQQRARIRAHHRGPLRTAERMLTWAYAAVPTGAGIWGSRGHGFKSRRPDWSEACCDLGASH
jgi:hypothetical protein